jgi:hypothetical protein
MRKNTKKNSRNQKNSLHLSNLASCVLTLATRDFKIWIKTTYVLEATRCKCMRLVFDVQ